MPLSYTKCHKCGWCYDSPPRRCYLCGSDLRDKPALPSEETLRSSNGAADAKAALDTLEELRGYSTEAGIPEWDAKWMTVKKALEKLIEMERRPSATDPSPATERSQNTMDKQHECAKCGTDLPTEAASNGKEPSMQRVGMTEREKTLRCLTDDQCDEFRRLPGSFNDMVRAIYAAGNREGKCREAIKEIVLGAVKHSSCEHRITNYSLNLAKKALSE